MPDVSSLKFIYSSFCTQYQSEAKFYIDEAHASGLRHLVVAYEKGGYAGHPNFAAGIPDKWSEQDLLDLILWPMKDPKAPYPAWEVPARAYGSPMLYAWWRGGPGLTDKDQLKNAAASKERGRAMRWRRSTGTTARKTQPTSRLPRALQRRWGSGQ